MVWLVHPTSFTWRFEFKQIWRHGTHFSHPSQSWDLWWRLTQMLATEILDTKYKKTDVVKVMKGLTHLDAHQKQTCFECYQKTKRCLMRLLMFIHMKRLSKEDNRARWISTSRQLNKVMRHKQYPLPIITDVLCKCSGYKCFTKLDVSMQYYTFERFLYHQHTIW
jgi:hypothetical protein